MKKFLFLLFFSWSFMVQGAFVSQNHPTLRFCEKYQMAGQFVAAYPRITPSIQALPWVPFVGLSLVPGLVEKPNIIQYICNTLTKISNLDVKDASFFIASELNDMTGNKWDKDLEMYTASFSLAETLWDFENGSARKGAFKSISTHAQINDFMNTTYGWYQKRFNGIDNAQLKDRAGREEEMNELASASYKVAALKDITNCPSGESSGNVNYQKLYKDKVSKHEKIKNETKVDIEFFEEKLYQMGIKIVANEQELSVYVKELKQLISVGVGYKNSPFTKTEKSIKKDPKKLDASGKPKVKDVTISRKAFKYSTITLYDLFNNFLSKYEEKWQTWTIAKISSQGYAGLLDDPKARTEAEFRDLNFECRDSKIMGNYDPNRPDFAILLEKEKEKCLSNLKIDHKKMQNLLNYYVKQLQSSLEKHKKANAEIWTIESDILGVNRNVSVEESGQLFPQENVVCEDAFALEYNDQLLLQNKKISANNDLKEIIAKNYTKQTSIEETKKQAEFEQKQELQRKQDFVNRKAKTDRKRYIQQKVPLIIELPKEENQ